MEMLKYSILVKIKLFKSFNPTVSLIADSFNKNY